MAVLKILHTPEKDIQTEYALTEPETIIGRHSTCTIRISDKKASRFHAKIIKNDNFYFLVDCNSSNGTYLNGVRITSMKQLEDEDIVEIGNTRFQFFNPDQVKEIIGGYQIIKEIARGGMGIVYKAKQISVDRIVALKILDDILAKNKRFVKRFISEAQAAGKLNHPNIIQVHEVGCDKGKYFYSMEYIEGKTLKQIIKERGPLSPQEAVEIIIQIAAGLHYAHEHGIIHRDIKPSNIMVTNSNIVKIADLGIAKVENTSLAEKHQIVGTPLFMSPEQIKGDDIDRRTDIYSLGVMFYYILTGKYPIWGEDIEEIKKSHLTDFPLPPSEYNENISEDLDKIILKCIEKKPENRFEDCNELINSLKKAKLKPHSSANLNSKISETTTQKDLLPVKAIFLFVFLIGIGISSYILFKPSSPVSSISPKNSSTVLDPYKSLLATLRKLDSLSKERVLKEFIKKYPNHPKIDFVKDKLDYFHKKNLKKKYAELLEILSRYKEDPITQQKFIKEFISYCDVKEIQEKAVKLLRKVENRIKYEQRERETIEEYEKLLAKKNFYLARRDYKSALMLFEVSQKNNNNLSPALKKKLEQNIINLRNKIQQIWKQTLKDIDNYIKKSFYVEAFKYIHHFQKNYKMPEDIEIKLASTIFSLKKRIMREWTATVPKIETYIKNFNFAKAQELCEEFLTKFNPISKEIPSIISKVKNTEKEIENKRRTHLALVVALKEKLKKGEKVGFLFVFPKLGNIVLKNVDTQTLTFFGKNGEIKIKWGTLTEDEYNKIKRKYLGKKN